MSPAVSQDEDPSHTGAVRTDTIERGSFTLGCCHRCGWTGPGRLARAVARRDALAHTLDCPEDRALARDRAATG